MKPVTLQDYKRRILRVLVHVQANLDNSLDLNELARLASFSPFHFHRVFRGMLGESWQSHVRRLRIERAAMHLKFSPKSVTQLAFDAGYESHEAFTRAFKQSLGVTPSEFRASKRHKCIDGKHVHYQTSVLRDFSTRNNGLKSMKVTEVTIPARRVAFVRHTGPYHECARAWDRLCTFLGQQGLLGGNNQFIGISHDDPEVTPPERIRYDACVTVDDLFQPRDDIGVQVVPGGDYAMTTHFGPYEGLSETYAKLLGVWLPRSGRDLRSTPCFEIYFNDPGSTAPADLVTDVYVPLV